MRKLPVAVVAVLVLASSLYSQTSPAAKAAAKTASAAPIATPDTTARPVGRDGIPVKRVVLYKNGVGYFEHSGRVHGTQEVSIDFTTAQLNDVLKSLAVVDLGGGKITGVRYNSIAPLNERLKTLQVPLGENVTSGAFLNALRGTRVEVRSGGGTALGKVLSVEQVQKETSKGNVFTATQISIITDAGELRSFELGPGTAVRVVDDEIRQDVGKYLNLVGSARSKDVRRMSISSSGNGDREMFVSYISEVPVWKSTYRIIVPKAPGTPFLQGWAIVDNTVGEDWKDVQMSLVSGAPQSFVQDISQPYYTRRPVVALPESAMLTPQAHEATMQEFDRVEQFAKLSPGVAGGVPGGQVGGVVGGLISSSASLSGVVRDPSGAIIPNARVTIVNEATGATRTANTDGNGRYQVFADAGRSRVKIEFPGFQTNQYSNVYLSPSGGSRLDATLNLGSVSQTVEVTASAPVLNTESASVAMVMRKVVPEAEGQALGDMFEYALKQKITVLKNQSALVPIVQSPIEAEKITLIRANEDGDEDGIPLRALWLRNTSGLTLDGGTFNILEEDSFAGEGVMEILHPNERRILSYAADTAVHVTGDSEEEESPATHVVIAKGLMKITREERSAITYQVRNADTAPRRVVIEHPLREQWKLVDGIKPEETTASHYRFRLKVEPGKTEKFTISEFRPTDSDYYLTNLNDQQIALFVSQRLINPALEQSLRKLLGKKNEISAVDTQTRLREQEITAIDRDQARVRENMKALKGSAEEKALLQRYTKQLDQQEDRMAALKNEITDLKDKRSKLSAELDQMAQEIVLDEKL